MQINVARGSQELGVFSPEEIRAGLASGQLQPTDYGWSEGMTEWTPLSSFPGLALAAAPPPMAARPAPVPMATPAPAAGPAAAVTTPGGKVQTSGAAVASLICGILSLTIMPCFSTLPAIICGHIARSNIKKSNGTLQGGGLALAGLIMGYLGTFILLPILAAIALPVFASVQVKGAETKSLSQAKSLAVACRLYAVDHEGQYPKTLEELVPEFIPNRDVFVCPLNPKEPMGYEYYGAGMKDNDPNASETIFIVSKALSKGKNRVVIYGDSSGRLVKDMPEPPAH